MSRLEETASFSVFVSWRSNCTTCTETMRISTRRTLMWAAAGAAGLITAVRAIQRAAQRVESTGDEAIRRLPGDELIAEPLGSLTHGITIRAAPREVWPWLAQMGAGRGGWYSYDRLDNGGHPSTRRIVPEFQRLTPGMILPAAPGAGDAFMVVSVIPDQCLVLGGKAPNGSWLVSWAFVLHESSDGTTRLVVRVRGGAGYRFCGVPWSVARLVVPMVHFVMERKQLLGIAERAEAHAVRSAA
jgi:hypothetical protein